MLCFSFLSPQPNTKSKKIYIKCLFKYRFSRCSIINFITLRHSTCRSLLFYYYGFATSILHLSIENRHSQITSVTINQSYHMVGSCICGVCVCIRFLSIAIFFSLSLYFSYFSLLIIYLQLSSYQTDRHWVLFFFIDFISIQHICFISTETNQRNQPAEAGGK